jgi:hypothetical protein
MVVEHTEFISRPLGPIPLCLELCPCTIDIGVTPARGRGLKLLNELNKRRPHPGSYRQEVSHRLRNGPILLPPRQGLVGPASLNDCITHQRTWLRGERRQSMRLSFDLKE